MSEIKPVEAEWHVDGLNYAGLIHGPADGLKVLALHGWMDHADSFRSLAPLLPRCRVHAVDLSGHGKSGHRAPHATYNIWDDLPQLVALTESWGWKDFVLLGHSRGASIAALYAAAHPEAVRALICLDSFLPQPQPAEKLSATLAAFIRDCAKQKAAPPRKFDNPDSYIARRMEWGNSAVVAGLLAERALQPVGEGFVLRADNRMFGSSAVRLSAEQICFVAAAIRCPILMLWAREGEAGTRQEAEKFWADGHSAIPFVETRCLPGDHHFHLDPCSAPAVAGEIARFLKVQGLLVIPTPDNKKAAPSI